MARNLEMAARIDAARSGEIVRFVVAGDSGAWPDPTAEAIFASLVSQVAALDPPPAFFANLGDFAGPGTKERHEAYLRAVEPLGMPDVCVVGNHDLDDPAGADTWAEVHGPMNFSFGHGHAHFVVLHAEPGVVGEVDVPGVGTAEGCAGPRDDDLAFLADALAAANEPYKVVLMHMPPFLGGHYAPHEDWGFRQRETEFCELLGDFEVGLVCCAHGLAFDTVFVDGVRYVMSGGGGTGLCSHYRGICTAGEGRPEDRGALFHAVELSIDVYGQVSGRVVQAFDRPGAPGMRFGDAPPGLTG